MENLCILSLVLTILLLSLAGVSTADTTPAEVAYIQGGHYELNTGTDGMSELTVTGIVPYFNLADGDSNRLIPIQNLSNISTPVNAALVVSDKGNETIAMARISGLTISDDAQTMTLQVQPLEFYEGTALEMFTSRVNNGGLHAGEYDGFVGFYLEIPEGSPENIVYPDPKPKHTDPPVYVS